MVTKKRHVIRLTLRFMSTVSNKLTKVQHAITIARIAMLLRGTENVKIIHLGHLRVSKRIRRL